MRDWCSECQFETYDGAEEPCINCVKTYNEKPSEFTPAIDEARGVGEWEDAKQHGLCRCSVCKDCYIEKDYITQAKWKYCPNCGAKMEVSEDE